MRKITYHIQTRSCTVLDNVMLLAVRLFSIEGYLAVYREKRWDGDTMMHGSSGCLSGVDSGYFTIRIHIFYIGSMVKMRRDQ